MPAGTKSSGLIVVTCAEPPITSTGTAIGSTITVTTGVGHGVPQVGSTIQIRGVNTSGYNGTYAVSSVVDSNNLQVIATQTLGSTTGALSDRPRFIISKWHGASVRVGVFDDQNGLFWEYDGQVLSVNRRSSTYQISGQAIATLGSTTVTSSSLYPPSNFMVKH